MKKAQAAMEFLMTYGWAILVVLVAIGALAYFGVLNPGRFLPSSCTLQPGLSCDEFKVSDADNTVTILIRNGMGDSVDFTALNLDVEGVSCTEIDPASIIDGAQTTTVITCPSAQIGSVGDRFKATITGTYTKGSSTLNHTLTGSITTKVE